MKRSIKIEAAKQAKYIRETYEWAEQSGITPNNLVPTSALRVAMRCGVSYRRAKKALLEAL